MLIRILFCPAPSALSGTSPKYVDENWIVDSTVESTYLGEAGWGQGSNPFSLKLRFIQLRIQPIQRQQILVRAALDDLPAVHH